MDEGIKILSGMQITTPLTSAQKKNTPGSQIFD